MANDVIVLAHHRDKNEEFERRIRLHVLLCCAESFQLSDEDLARAAADCEAMLRRTYSPKFPPGDIEVH